MATKRGLTAAEAVARSDVFPLDLLRPLRPVIIGPMAALRRYDVAAEKTLLGEYDKVDDTVYDWPDLASGETPDLDYAKIYLESAKLNYFNKYIGSGGSAQPSSTYPNRVRAANYVFKTGNGTDRNAAFYDRDVAIGDLVQLRATVGDLIVFNSSVTGFVGETVASSRAAAAANANNRAGQSATASIEQVDDTPINDIEAAVSGAAYNSLDDGYITRTYTITVTQAGSGNDATTARLRVRSSDGLDDQDNVTPAAFGAPTSIGTKGLTVTWTINGSASSASLFGIDEDDFVVGQAWTVIVSQLFAAPTATSAGTYTGPSDLTYIVTVSEGGVLGSSSPTITVTSSTGVDRSGPTVVSAAATPVAVGSYGVTISFTGARLCAGDIYTIACAAESEGAYKTLVLNDDVPANLQGVEVDVRLFIPQTEVELSKIRELPSAAVNWSADVENITVESAIYLTDSSLTDGSDLVPVPLESATMYIHYRAWSEEGGATIVRLNARADVEAALGTVHPDNPLAYGVDLALANTATELLATTKVTAQANSDVVLAVALGGDPTDADLWEAALEALEDDPDAGQLVPLTSDDTILSLVKAHVEAQSSNSVGYYRSMWAVANVDPTAAKVDADTTTDEEVALATISATPVITPTEYTTLTCTSGNVAFITDGIRAGDVVRINFDEDLEGNATYDTYEIEAVISESTVRLVTGPLAAISVAIKFEIWRTYTKPEYAAAIVAKVADFTTDDGRCRVLWPNEVETDEGSVAGYFGAAAIAGLAGSVPSNQGLSGVGVEGVTSVTKSTPYFRPAQLNDLADAGVFVLATDRDGNVFVRSAFTPDTASYSTKEEMCVRNADAVRLAILESWSALEGISNTTDITNDALIGKLATVEQKLKATGVGLTIGAPVTSLNLVSNQPVTGQPTQRSLTVQMVGPTPLNKVLLTLNVSE